MKKNVQFVIQLAALSLFIFLFVTGKVQIRMGLFLLGIAGSFILGRFYCGWFCSINTSMLGVSWIKKKLGIKSLKIPTLLKQTWFRYLLLIIFVGVFLFIMLTGQKLPVLPFLFFAGILITFVFPEELWHRYLCPYGTLLAATSAKSLHYLKIEEDSCTNCGACIRVCPAKAIAKPVKKPEIQKSDCLLCMKCEKVCKEKAISYR